MQTLYLQPLWRNRPAKCKAINFGEITQKWLLRRSRSFKVTDFGTSQRLIICDFLLVIDINLPPYLAPFPRYGRLLVKFSPSLGRNHVNMQINFSSLETGMIFLPDAENRTIVSSFVWTKHWNVTEGQTDRIPLAINADAL